MATEIATAYVSLIPSTSKIAPGVRSALGEVERDTAATSSSMGSSLATGIGTGVAAVTALLGGLTLKGGFTRALAIDNAQAKMKALGYSATDVQGVMDTALASVKGTAFGLGDAASLATQLIAGGIKPGQDLARALGNTADIAAVANVSLGDLSPVMGQLASSSHLYTQDLLQLQQRGLPVFSWLADSLGKTQTEVRDMVSAGDVSFAQLQTAIEQHVGGAAKATDSFKASWSNVLAALSRTGAVVATPALSMLKGVFDQAIPAIDAVTSKITPLVATLAGRLAPVVTDLATRISGWVQSTGGLSASFSGLSAILLPLGGALAALGGGGLVGALSPLGRMLPVISGPMGLILGSIAALISQSPELKTALGDAFLSLGGALQNLAPLFPVLADVATSLANTLGGALASVISTAVVPLIQMLANTVLPALLPSITTVLGLVTDLAFSLGGFLAGAIQSLMPQLMALITAALPVLVQILGALMPVIVQLITAVLPVIMSLITALVPVVLAVVQAFLPLLPVLGSLVTALLPPLAQIITAVIAVVAALVPIVVALLNAFLPLLPVFVQLVQALLPVVIQLVQALVPVITLVVGVLAELLAAIMPVVMWIAQKLVAAISGLITWVTNAIPAIASFVTQGISAVGQFAQSVGEKIGEAVRFFIDLPGKILGVLSGAGSWLLDVGKNIIQGLIDGIMSAFNKVKDVLSNLTDLLPDWKGPASVDATLLTGNGRLIMRSLVSGFQDEAPAVQKYLAGFTADIGAASSANLNVSVSGAPANGQNSQDAGNSLPSSIALLDADGSLLGHMRVVAGQAVASVQQAARDVASRDSLRAIAVGV